MNSSSGLSIKFFKFCVIFANSGKAFCTFIASCHESAEYSNISGVSFIFDIANSVLFSITLTGRTKDKSAFLNADSGNPKFISIDLSDVITPKILLSYPYFFNVSIGNGFSKDKSMNRSSLFLLNSLNCFSMSAKLSSLNFSA